MSDQDLLKAVKTLSNENILPIDTVFNIVERVILESIKKEHPHNDAEVSINRHTGHIVANKKYAVVSNVNNTQEITLEDAQKIDPTCQIGDFVRSPINYNKITRNTIHAFKQYLHVELQEAKWLQQCEEYGNKIGILVSGVVSRTDHGNIILKIENGTADAIIFREDLLPQEILRPKDKVRACIKKVMFSKTVPPIQTSRKSPDFLLQLLKHAIPEIESDTIKIKGIARDPGNRSKIAVYSNDKRVNPVGACVGYKANRVLTVSKECMNEKLEVIAYSDNLPEYVMNALGDVDVKKVIINEENKNITVVTTDKSIKSAIGPRGQNVQLASQLMGRRIDIITEQEEENKRAQEMNSVVNLFVTQLNVEETLALLLYKNYFMSIEEIANNKNDLSSIPGLTPETVDALYERATQALVEKQHALQKTLDNLGVDKAILDIPNMTCDIAITLGNNGITSLEKFAELSIDELLDKELGILKDKKLDYQMVADMLLYSRRLLNLI